MVVENFCNVSFVPIWTPFLSGLIFGVIIELGWWPGWELIVVKINPDDEITQTRMGLKPTLLGSISWFWAGRFIIRLSLMVIGSLLLNNMTNWYLFQSGLQHKGAEKRSGGKDLGKECRRRPEGNYDVVWIDSFLSKCSNCNCSIILTNTLFGFQTRDYSTLFENVSMAVGREICQTSLERKIEEKSNAFRKLQSHPIPAPSWTLKIVVASRRLLCHSLLVFPVFILKIWFVIFLQLNLL